MRRHLARVTGWLAGMVLAGAAAGCGVEADRLQVRAATERFYAAVAAGDGRTACAQLSPDTRAALAEDDGERCEAAVLELSLRGRTARSVEVYATSAQVVLVGGDTVFLGEGRRGWRIQAAGCRPRRGGPFDCEAEA